MEKIMIDGTELSKGATKTTKKSKIKMTPKFPTDENFHTFKIETITDPDHPKFGITMYKDGIEVVHKGNPFPPKTSITPIGFENAKTIRQIDFVNE